MKLETLTFLESLEINERKEALDFLLGLTTTELSTCEHKWVTSGAHLCKNCNLLATDKEYLDRYSARNLSHEDRAILLLNALSEAEVPVQSIDWEEEKVTIVLAWYRYTKLFIYKDKLDIGIANKYGKTEFSVTNFCFNFNDINLEKDIHGSLLYVIRIRSEKRR